MIYVCGDLHGTLDSFKLTTRAWTEQRRLTKKDVLIQLGDFGHIWSPLSDRKQQARLAELANRKYTMLVVLGNHENYTEIERLPIAYKELVKGDCRVLHIEDKEILFAVPGQLYTIEGKTFLPIQGATSIDKHMRTQGISWWPQENMTMAQQNQILDAVAAVGNKVDYIVSHTCPAQYIEDFSELKTTFPCATASFLNHIFNTVEFGEWHFGHMHYDYTLVTEKGPLTCHYNRPPFLLQ